MAIRITETMRELILRQHWEGDDGRNVWIEWQGERLTVKVLQDPARQVPTETRGEIKGYSDASRFRSLNFIAGIDWMKAGECWFVTLSYPDDVDWSDYAVRQMHLSTFARHLKTHYERPVPFVWRIEWKIRQSGRCVGLIAPHVHLLVFNCPMLTNRNVNLWWSKSIQWPHYVNTWTEFLRDREIVGIYICKYAAKEDPLLGYDAYLSRAVSGRAWGKRYEEFIPCKPVHVMRTTINNKTMAVMHHARGEAKCWALGYNDSFTVLGEDAPKLAKYLRKYTVDGELPNV